MTSKEDIDNLARRTIEEKFLDIRFIQIGSISTTELFKIIANVFEETGGKRESRLVNRLVEFLQNKESKKS